jgi:glycosyltransferase involved in cell wall biosynthesis
VTELSIVIPVRDEAAELPRTMAALQSAVDRSGFRAELVLVDDGSTDGSGDVVRASIDGRLPLQVMRLPGLGRFEARRAGVEAATADVVLLLDSRVRLDPDALRFLRERLAAGESVWNAHVHVDSGSPLGVFWSLLAELAWREYFDRPRTTSFGADDFDRFPKGTTCFAAPRDVLLQAFDSFRSRYRDARLANDDTPILRSVAARSRIGISPRFACSYTPRTTLARFVRHAAHRGTVFVDGHGTRASRFFPAVVAFFPLSAAIAVAAVRRPAVIPLALGASGAVAAAYGVRAGRSRQEVAVLFGVTPIYAAAHGIGMWRGLIELLR